MSTMPPTFRTPVPVRVGALAAAGLVAATAAGLVGPAAVADAAPAAPAGGIVPPARTSVSLTTPFGPVGSPNAGESRPALSEIKLYMADWVLTRGDGSARDRVLCERMIRASDDAAAQELWAKYGPVTVSSPAAHYGLTATRPGAAWGTSRTSAADLTRFLDAKRTGDPDSPILRWMRDADPVAADGTRQNWGTSRYTGVQGSKWGWSSYGPSVVASASFGRDFSFAAITYGTPAQQNADLAWSVADTPGTTAAPTLVTGSVDIPLPEGLPLPDQLAAQLPIDLPAPDTGSLALPATTDLATPVLQAVGIPAPS